MNEITETTATLTPPKAKPIPKKAVTKAATKGTKPTAKKAKPAKKAAVERKSKEGLRDPQARILRVLSKARAPFIKSKINEACAAAGFATAEKFTQWMADPLGSPNPETRPVAEERSGYPSLLTLKYVKQVTIQVMEKDTIAYEITAAGRAALVEYDAQQKEKAKAAKGK